MAPLAVEPVNEHPDRCAACGGQCCRTRPGIEAPERYLAAPDPVAALAADLAAGDFVLVEHVGKPWEGGRPPGEADRRRVIHYPRPATVAERAAGGVLPGAAPSDCVFLVPGGCRLAFEARPRMCRSLEPAPDFDCEAAWDRRAAALAWWPHQPLVGAARTRAAARDREPPGAVR